MHSAMQRTSSRAILLLCIGVRIVTCEFLQARIVDDALVFDEPNGFERLLSEGFFFLQVPRGMNLTQIKMFGKSFYKEKVSPINSRDNVYRGYRDPSNLVFQPDAFGRSGYKIMRNQQIEKVSLQDDILQAHYPSEVVDTARSIASLGSHVLHSVLRHLGIPEDLQNAGLGSCSSTDPHFILSMYHYRPELDFPGAVMHKDMGWITLLYTEKPGLEALVNGEWLPVGPVPGHFIVNFGSYLEVFTQHLATPAVAALHRVVRQQSDRHSLNVAVIPHGNKTGKVFAYLNQGLVSISQEDFENDIMKRHLSKDGSLSPSSTWLSQKEL